MITKELKTQRRNKRIRIRVKKEPFIFPEIKHYVLDRRDYEMPEAARGKMFLEQLWYLRKEFIMKWNFYPSYLIINIEDSYANIYKEIYNSFRGSGEISHTTNGNNAHKFVIFDLKVIETNNVKQNEFFLA